MLLKYPVFGGNICPRITKNSLILVVSTTMLKPVIFTERIVIARRITTASGARERFWETLFPFEIVKVFGRKILS